jgi:hypothetical protein
MYPIDLMYPMDLFKNFYFIQMIPASSENSGSLP